MAVVAASWWRHRTAPVAGLAVLALAVPFAHLYTVDRAVAGALGARAAVTVDGAAVVVAWSLAVFAAVRARAA
jgi:hypothetical protein